MLLEYPGKITGTKAYLFGNQLQSDILITVISDVNTGLMNLFQGTVAAFNLPIL